MPLRNNYKFKTVFLKYLILSLVILNFILTKNTYADIIVISNKVFSADKISTKKLKKLWLGKTKKINPVGRVYIVDQPENEKITREFYNTVINKNPKQVQAYWAKIIFIGKGFPPKIMSDDLAVIKWVLEKNNRIGYIHTESKTSEVKILLTIGESK